MWTKSESVCGRIVFASTADEAKKEVDTQLGVDSNSICLDEFLLSSELCIVSKSVLEEL